MNPIFRYLVVLSFLFSMAVYLSCTEDVGETPLLTQTGSASFSIIWPDQGSDKKNSQAEGNPHINCRGISVIDVKVYEDPNDRYLADGLFYCRDGEGTVYGISAGKNRRFKISVLSFNNELLYQGEKGSVTIKKDRITPVGRIPVHWVGPDNVLPVATIIPPESGVYNSDEKIDFEGKGEDREDGELDGSYLTWESNIDGNISTGPRLEGIRLSPGYHTITLTVTDSDGSVDTDTIELTVTGTIDNSVDRMAFSILGTTFPATFDMGSPDGSGGINGTGPEPGRNCNETLHEVTITEPFLMQTTEVTNAQYVSFLNDVKTRGTEKEPWFETKNENADSRIIGSIGNFSVESDYENRPVTNVSWYGAEAFADWLSEKEGKVYRLPTEAQWEFAARAGAATAFANGEITVPEGNDPVLNLIGWYRFHPGYEESPHEVAQLKPNDWGLYDMYGNAREWCQDWYGSYLSVSVTDPTGPSFGALRILRGGGWQSRAMFCRSASREWFVPDFLYVTFGFRLVLLPGQQQGR